LPRYALNNKKFLIGQSFSGEIKGESPATVDAVIAGADESLPAFMLVQSGDGGSEVQAQPGAPGFEVDGRGILSAFMEHEGREAVAIILDIEGKVAVFPLCADAYPLVGIFIGIIDDAANQATDQVMVEETLQIVFITVHVDVDALECQQSLVVEQALFQHVAGVIFRDVG